MGLLYGDMHLIHSFISIGISMLQEYKSSFERIQKVQHSPKSMPLIECKNSIIFFHRRQFQSKTYHAKSAKERSDDLIHGLNVIHFVINQRQSKRKQN